MGALAKWRSARPRTRYLLAGGVFLAFLWFGRRQLGGAVKVLGQAFNPDGTHAPWSGDHLGLGTTTVGVGGCVLASLAMAFNKLNAADLGGSTLTPRDLNQLLQQHPEAWLGRSSVMETGPAMSAVGLTGGKLVGGSVMLMRSALDEALAKGGTALVRVFHGADKTNGDHTVLVYGKSGPDYIAADPALARTITFGPTLASGAGAQWGNRVPYQVVNVHQVFA